MSLLLLLIASFIVFAGVRMTVDPTAGFANAKDPELRAREEKRLGLDQSIFNQYKKWITKVAHGDLGKGDRNQRAVSAELKRAFTKTMDLAIWGSIVALIFGISFGIISAIRRNKPIDYALSGFSYFGIAIPTFAFAYFLMFFFSLWLPQKLHQSEPWLFTTGNTDGRFGLSSSGIWTPESISTYFRHMAMPIMVLSIQLIAGWSRYQRASMIEALQSDYIRTARSKGMSKFRVYSRHALRNSEVPMVTVIALDIGILFGGLIVTEQIFSIPGMGKLFVDSLTNGDATTIAGWTLVTAFFVIVGNLIADLILPLIDPRIRTQ